MEREVRQTTSRRPAQLIMAEEGAWLRGIEELGLK